MKAYRLSSYSDEDAGAAIVFANTAREAKRLIYSADYLSDRVFGWGGGWIDIRVNRAPHFDGMEVLSAAELALEQWKDGWRWFDVYPKEPDVDEASNQDFLNWYTATFDQTNQPQ